MRPVQASRPVEVKRDAPRPVEVIRDVPRPVENRPVQPVGQFVQR